jgi:lipoate-protein ligase A
MKTNLLKFENLSIQKQLELEKRLLKEESENYLLINLGSEKTIVMGISQKPEEVVDLELAKSCNIPLIKRFSGGGTVIVDPNTIFVTFIFDESILNAPLYPKNILNWTKDFFYNALEIDDFDLRGNDFTLGNKKIGGNAQYLKKGRFLQHTSFLWDYEEKNMDFLLHPPKEPEYRQKRSHKDFLTKLSPIISKSHFTDKIINYANHELSIYTESVSKMGIFKILDK